MKGKLYFAAILFSLGFLPLKVGILLLVTVILWSLPFWMKHKIYLGGSISLFFFSTFLTATMGPPPSIESTYQGSFSIQSHPVTKEFYTEFEIELPNELKILARTEHPPDSLKLGASCQGELVIEPPQKATNPGQFDYANFLSSQGIHAITNEPIIMDCSGSSYFSKLYRIRDDVLTHLDMAFHPTTAMWIKAILLGERQGFDDETMESFQFWNISHLLAISGLHVAIILATCYGVLYYVFRTSRETAMNVMLAGIPFYILMAGSHPSVIRAGLMAALVIVMVKFRNRMPVIDILSLVYIAVLMINPYLMNQLSFQFSFIVTACLLLSNRIITQDGWVWMSLKISLISQLALLPLQFYYFYYTNVLSFLMNLLFVPYFTLFMIPVLLILFFVSFIDLSMARMIENIFIQVNEPMINALNGLEPFLFAQWLVGKPHLITIFLAYICLFGMMYWWNRSDLRKALIFGCLLISCFWIQQSIPYMDSTYRITMLDVGQGDSFVVELPYRSAVMMIDIGEEVNYSHLDQPNRNFNQVVQPFLWSKGIQQIDALVISHFDYDHAAGATTLIEHFDPEQTFIAARSDDEIINEYLGNVEPIQVKKQHQIKMGGAELNVLSPETPVMRGNENNHSLVVELQVDGHRTLFAGDLEAAGELRLLENGAIRDVDLLKVGHHGSSTSTSLPLLQQLNLNGKDAFISVGEDNSYGHPSIEVINRLEDQGNRIWRTDIHGAVEMKYTNGQSTFLPFKP